MDENKEKPKKKTKNPKTHLGTLSKIHAWQIALIAVGATAMVGGVTAGVVAGVRFAKHDITYICEGVDERWIEQHPFDTSSLPKTYQKRKSVELISPKIDGYQFQGWYLEGTERKLIENDKLVTTKLSKPVTLIAKYEIITYNVTLNLNNGQLSGLVDDVYDNHTYTFEADTAKTTYVCLDEPFRYPSATRLGYDFSNSGWKNDSSNMYYEGCITSSLADITLSADWSLHPYNVAYAFTGEGVSEFESEIINNNTHISDFEKEVVLTEPYLKGYTFDGWYDTNGNQLSKIPVNTFPSSNDLINLTGRFTPIVYTISYSDESDSDHSLLPTTYKRCSSDVNIPNINPFGYNFKGWLSSNSTSLEYVNTIPHNSTGNITFTADVQLLTYHISFVLSGVKSDFVDTFNLKDTVVTYTVRKDSFNLPNANVPGYTFLGFFNEYDEEVNPLIQKGSMIGDKVYTAKFEPTPYTLTFVNTRKNTETYRTYTIEDSFNIADVASTGYTFDGWFDGNDIKRTGIAVGDAVSLQNCTLTTKWTLNTYYITYSYNGLSDGAYVNNPNPTTYNYEINVNLEEPTVNGYRFLGWTAPGISTPVQDYSIIRNTTTGNLSLTANFEKIQYSIKYSYRNNGTGSLVNNTEYYYVDTPSFTLPMIASDTRQFMGWKEKTTNVLYAPSATFGGGQTQDFVFEAVWGYKGEGTLADPYQIYDADQLEQIIDFSKAYILMNDITIASDVSDVWQPVGNYIAPFNGDFDGDSHTISLVISANSKNNPNFATYFGIFGYCGSASNIHDVNISGSVGASDNRFLTNTFGIVAARTSGVIENCVSSVRSYLTSNNEDVTIVGGIAGVSSPARIINCGCTGAAYLNIDAPNVSTVYVGGIAGSVSGGELASCYNRSNIISNAYYNSYAGGLVGNNDYSSCTHISWTNNPLTENPFTGSVTSTTVSSSGNAGMAQYSSTYCIIGSPAYAAASSNTETFVAGVYYYIVMINGAGNKGAMTWGRCLTSGTNSFDYNTSHPYFIQYTI